MELSVVEQRYRAVLCVQAGESAVDVAARFGVSRQTVQNWLRRYRERGLEGLVEQSRRPNSSPAQTGAEVESVICELRRSHPRWGARRIAHELAKAGMEPVPARITVHQVLACHGLVEPRSRRRKREDYRRWERSAPMALWQLDTVGGVLLQDGAQAKVVTFLSTAIEPRVLGQTASVSDRRGQLRIGEPRVARAMLETCG